MNVSHYPSKITVQQRHLQAEPQDMEEQRYQPDDIVQWGFNKNNNYLENSKFNDSTLKIKDLDQLKNKIIKVIIIVLIVKFFEKTLKYSETFTSSIDFLYFGLSILTICLGFFLTLDATEPSLC